MFLSYSEMNDSWFFFCKKMFLSYIASYERLLAFGDSKFQKYFFNPQWNRNRKFKQLFKPLKPQK